MMRAMLLRMVSLFAAFVLAWPAYAQTLDKIDKTGVLTLGFIDGASPFSSQAIDGEPQGYSIDLCRAVAGGIALQLGKPQLQTRWVKLTLQNRIEAVQRKQVDIECGTTTWTFDRQRAVDFSLVTFVEGGSVLIQRQAKQLRRLEDFASRRIAVIGGTTTEKALRDALSNARIRAEVVLVATRDEGLGLLRVGKVHGFASDRTTLLGVVAKRGEGDTFRVLDWYFSIEQYALMLPRDDQDFRVAVNRTLARLYRSGEIKKVYDRWLGASGPPSALLSSTYLIQSLE